MRTTISSIFATFQLALIGLGVPVAVFFRLQDQLHPLQTIDPVLAIGVAIWLVLAKAAFTSSDVIDSSVVNMLSPMWQAQRMVERSLLGVGAIGREEAPPSGLFAVVTPGIITPDQLPVNLLEAVQTPSVEQARERIRLGEDEIVRAIPVLDDLGPAMQPVLETEEYIVARGDTFWSIADVVFGDGRLWTQLLEMNFGREVAPGILLDEDDELRIGWSILLPVVQHGDNDEEHDGGTA